jgi:hypothetical protein
MTCGDRMPRQAAEGPSSLPEGGHSNAALCRYGVVLRWASARMPLSTPSRSSRIQTTIILVWSSELSSIRAIGSSLSNRHAPLLLHDAGGSTARPTSVRSGGKASRIAATMSGEACEGLVVMSRCQTATACTLILRQFAEHRKTLCSRLVQPRARARWGTRRTGARVARDSIPDGTPNVRRRTQQ